MYKTFFEVDYWMVRPTKYDRETALAAATDSIWRNGFERSSVKQLSELLGMTRSSFYNAFGSQEDLFRACLPTYSASSPDAPLYADVSGEVLPLISEVFRDICRKRAQDPEGRGCLIINTVSELCPAAEGLGAHLEELVLASIERFEMLLNVARDNGEIGHEENTHALALALQNLMIGLNVLCKVVRDEDELWLLTRTTLEGLGLYHETGDGNV